MSKKFHINKHGVPAPCHAKEGNCPLGGDSGEENHFDTPQEAQAAADEQNEAKHGVLPEMNSSNRDRSKKEEKMFQDAQREIEESKSRNHPKAAVINGFHDRDAYIYGYNEEQQKVVDDLNDLGYTTTLKNDYVSESETPSINDDDSFVYLEVKWNEKEHGDTVNVSKSITEMKRKDRRREEEGKPQRGSVSHREDGFGNMKEGEELSEKQKGIVNYLNKSGYDTEVKVERLVPEDPNSGEFSYLDISWKKDNDK